MRSIKAPSKTYFVPPMYTALLGEFVFALYGPSGLGIKMQFFVLLRRGVNVSN
jgi:hypothetical protein